MTTPTPTAPIADAEPIPYRLISGPAWGIQLRNGRLYRDEHAQFQDPDGAQPTVYFRQDAAEIAVQLTEALLEVWYGIEAEIAALRVVAVEMDPVDGIWKPVRASTDPAGYRPLDPDTYVPADLPCLHAEALTLDQARAVMRQHRACAGEMPCRVRGRARALLARSGVMRLNRRPSAWQGLALPEMAG